MKINNKAFTLVELLVVVLIIGILAAIAVPQYQKATLKSKTQRARFLLNTLNEAEEAFYLTTGNYADNINKLDVSVDSEKAFEHSNTPQGLSESDYKYTCNVQYCAARSANKNLPHLLYYHQKYHNGIQLCAVEGENTQRARDVCESIGTLDPIFDEYDWGKNNYYRIN